MVNKNKKIQNISLFRHSYEVVREAYQVSRPAMGLVTSSLYLYKNPNPSIWMALYFAFILQMGANAGNDYMDWERDLAEPDREFSVSRGKARSRDYAWYFYLFPSLVAVVIGFLDPFQGILYFVIGEFAGQYLYNGIFCGFAMNELSIVKSFGFPLDFFVACWTYMPYAHLSAQRRFFPTWTISAWGTTMLWAQMKDYEHEKNSNVKTTATSLGPNVCRSIISAAAVIMMYGDWRFFMYGFYTFYRCWYPVLTGKQKTKGKMSVMMALNLVLITIFDEKLDNKIKWPCYLAQIFAFTLYRFSYIAEQKFYALQGILNRHKPYDPDVWLEKDPDILLWKIGAIIGRSATGAMSLFNFEFARGCLMGYIVFRVQDTWADVAIGSESRIKGLALLPNRFKKIEEGIAEVEADDVDDVQWDLESRERNKLYVDVTKYVHRFDSIYKLMESSHRKILREYAEDLSNGFRELELLKDAPITSEIMRKHTEVANDAGFFGMCKAMSPELLKAIQTDTYDIKTHAAYIGFTDYLWYMNLAASIEEDVKEGVALDEELQNMEGFDRNIVNKVRLRWLIKANEEFLKSGYFVYHPALIASWPLRLFIYHFYQTSINICEKYYFSLKDGTPFKKISGVVLLLRSIEANMSKDGYMQAMQNALQYASFMNQKLKEI